MSDVLPLALGIAASPLPVLPTILLLFTPRWRRAAGAFVAGWALGVAAWATAFVFLADVIETGVSSPAWASWARIGLGGLLLVLAARGWRTKAETDDAPKWMQSIEAATPARAFRLSLLLSAANPKCFLLAGAAGITLGSAGLGTLATVASVVGFTALASSSTAFPLLLRLVVGERILVPLAAVKDWLQANSARLVAGVLAAIGIMLLVEGISALT